MAFVLRHLFGPLLLLVALSTLLLLMDSAGRGDRDMPHVAVVQTSSNPVMEEGVSGILRGLAKHGFVDGKNLRVTRFNAENDISTANMIGTQIANDRYDLVLTAGTQMLQAVANANKTRQAKHIFCLVTDPVASGVGIGPEPLNHPAHLVGYGSKPPVRRGFDLLLAMNPNARRIGVAFNPAEINSVVTVETARAEAKNLVGIYAALAGVSSADVLKEFAGQGFGAFKPKLADLAVSVMGPLGGEMRRLLADPAEIDRVLTAGAERARALAAPTVAEVKKLVGYWAG